MLFTFLGTVFGGLMSIFPEIMRYLNGKQDRKHEIDMTKLQAEIYKQQADIRYKELDLTADIVQSENLYKTMQPTGVAWVDAFSATVRPVLTYAFFLLYAGVKAANFWILMHILKDASWATVMQQLWGEMDMAIFAAIVTFWFGNRTFDKMRARRK